MVLNIENALISQGSFSLRADFSVPLGSRIALLGPSGAGKSTFLSALAGFVPLQSGRLFWQGQDITGLRPAERPISMVFQDNNLFPHMSVWQNIGLALDPNLRLSQAQKSEIEAVMERTGLHGLDTRKPGALSGGQQSRVALARALLRRRPLLLLDEPFAALGPALRMEMLDLVAEITRTEAMTLLMITHEPRDAERIADQISVVAEGRAHDPQNTKALLCDPPAALKVYLGD